MEPARSKHKPSPDGGEDAPADTIPSVWKSAVNPGNANKDEACLYVCMLFISTVDQPIERVTIQALDCC